MFRRGLIVVLLLFSASWLFAEANKRLILKDGSYQVITKYEIQGDRVRYFSAERFEWEDVPKILVDWDATKKYEEDLKKDVAHSSEQIQKELEEEKALEDAKTPEVAPNLRLPITGGVFVLDYYRDVPQLIELHQNVSEINKDMKGNIIRATINPFASNKQKIQVPGPHAKVQVHVPRPTVFFNVEDAPEPDKDKQPTAGNVDRTDDALLIPPKAEQRYRFVKMEEKKDSRIVGNLKITMTGKMSQQQTFVPTRGELMGGGWVKIVPEQDLVPGEYAVVEMLGEKEMNLYVWDIGVNPSAPENASAWKPEAPKPEGPVEPPKLEKRTK
ncbi:MAG TPA: hypothetical protein VN577_19215 [Terriglobales bacterium]|nr:hypothetical protein [Terriglobales bacterium]